MSKKRSRTYVTNPARKEDAKVIDMNQINRKKAYCSPGFKTGTHITEKDRPRKKNWIKEAGDYV